MDTKDFVIWEMSSRDTVDFKKIYVDVSGDLISGLLLSQIVYWHLPSKETGQSKLRVQAKGFFWLVKERDEWWEEIRISPKQYDRAIKILEKKKIVVLDKLKFKGQPLVHIRLDWDNFLSLWFEELNKKAEQIDPEPYSPMGIPERSIPELPKGQFPNYPKVNTGIPERSIPSYTENTHKEHDIEHNIDHSQSVRQLVETIAYKVWSNIPPERLTDIIACYVCFNDKLDGMDLYRILTKVKDRQSNRNKIKSSGQIKDFKKYVWSCMEDAIKQLETVQIQTKEPVRKELVPDWLERENDRLETPEKKELTDEEIKARKKEIEELLNALKENK